MTRTASTTTSRIRRLAMAIGGAVALFGTASVASAQDGAIRFTQRPGSEVRLNGTTTIRASWTCRSDSPDASMDLTPAQTDGLLDGTTRAEGAAPGAVQRIRLRVKAADLDCGNPFAGRALRKALHGQDVIGEFRLASGTTSTSSKVRVSGQLTVAGVTREVVLDVATEWATDGTVRASGSMPLNLSDFNIDPPRVMLSAVRAADRLTVSFDLVLAAAEPVSSGLIARRTAARGGR